MTKATVCPNCNANLQGGLIWEHFYREFTQGEGYWLDSDGNYIEHQRLLGHIEAERAADNVAASYGATRTRGRWGRQIALYSYEKDRTVAYTCPDCKHQWEI